MSDPDETPTLTPEELAQALGAFADVQRTANFIVSKLLPQHRGKWLVFNHTNGEYEILASREEAFGKLVGKGSGMSVVLIDDHGQLTDPPTVQ